MTKIYYNKQKDVYQVIIPYSLTPFSNIWNPQEDKIITKEHLKKFIEEGFLYNFKRSGPYASSSPYDSNENTAISEFAVIYSDALYFYLDEKGKIHRRYCDNSLQYFVDSSYVYKLFSHLISEENFSLLLEKQLKRVFESSYFSFEMFEFFTFISSKEKLLSLEKELTPFEIEDEGLFMKYLDESVVDLDESKKEKYNPSSLEKLTTSFEELDKYLV